MSWNNIETSDLDLNFIRNNGRDTVVYTCPRCGCRQMTIVNLDDLIYGVSFKCQNVDICGEGEMYFDLKLSIEISGYKGLSDRPLNLPKDSQR